MNDLKLPLGWTKTELGEALISIIGGGTPSRRLPSYFEGDIPWFTVKDMKTAKPQDAEEHISAAAVAASATNIVPANTLIVATRIALGKAIKPTVACAINQDLKALIVGTGIDANFLLYWIEANERIIQELGSGTTVSGIRLDTLRGLPLYLPPSAEQTRIVAKVEELLSDLDSAVTALKSAKVKIPQFRHSLLRSAIDGSLTAKWRKSNASPETGTRLLKRILEQRQARWDEMQVLRSQKADGSPSQGWAGKYSEPKEADISHRPDLPKGWAWATLSQIGWLDRGRSKFRPRNSPHLYGGAYPFVQTGDIRKADSFISKVEATYSDAGLEQSRLWPAGTMCITIAANIGKTAILSMEACFPDSIVGFIPGADEVSIRYVEYFMRAVQPKLEDEAPATAQKNINLEVLNKVALPIPPFTEQTKIVDLLDGYFADALNKEESIELAIKQSSVQRKNILKAAFTGQLLPQNPVDESSILLLDRIRAERTQYEKELIQKPKNEGAPKVKKDVKNTLRDWIRLHENDEFSFQELSKSISGVEYDVLKEAIFEILGEKKSPIIQYFDQTSKRMAFKRIKP
ncbi:MAG: restriction endonuclease subunit S [Telluria sp.]